AGTAGGGGAAGGGEREERGRRRGGEGRRQHAVVETPVRGGGSGDAFVRARQPAPRRGGEFGHRRPAAPPIEFRDVRPSDPATAIPPVEAARRAAERAGVVVREVETLGDIRRACRLLADVWGTDEGHLLAPELARALSHA